MFDIAHTLHREAKTKAINNYLRNKPKLMDPWFSLAQICNKGNIDQGFHLYARIYTGVQDFAPVQKSIIKFEVYKLVHLKSFFTNKKAQKCIRNRQSPKLIIYIHINSFSRFRATSKHYIEKTSKNNNQ